MTDTSPDDELAGLFSSENGVAEELTSTESVPALVFRVGGWWFALAPGAVLEVGALTRLNPVPSLPPHIIGLVLRRNSLVPVVDLAKLIDIPSGGEATTAPRVVVVDDGRDSVGIRADEAHGIVEIVQNLDERAIDHVFVSGSAEWSGHHVHVLELDPLMSATQEL